MSEKIEAQGRTGEMFETKGVMKDGQEIDRENDIDQETPESEIVVVVENVKVVVVTVMKLPRVRRLVHS